LTDLHHRLEYPGLEGDARDALTNLEPVEREVALPGAEDWYLARWVPYRNLDDQLAGVVLTMVDITESRRAQQDLEASQHRLVAALQETERARAVAESALQAKDRFLAMLSHELRTPLNPVLMGIHLLRRESQMSPRTMELLAMLQRNVELEARLIDELLDITRISNDKLTLNRQVLDLHDIIRAAVDTQEDALAARGQALTLKLEAEDSEVHGDSDRLQQVIWNLIQNASKFSADGDPITIHSSNAAGRIVVRVTDAGVGLHPDDLSTIFEPFAQRAGATGRGGLGLGLAIARSVVEAHDGEVQAQSQGKGLGTTFTVSLPLAREVAP
jgi:signal transduction histidine kinase